MTNNREFLVQRWSVALTAALCCFASVAVAALQPRIELDGRIQTADGATVDGAIAPGAVLRSGDELRLRVTAWADGHLYVIALGSSGTAVLLHPFENGSADSAQRIALPAPVRGGETISVPGDGGYLPLDDRIGREMIVAFVADEPVESLTRLMFRMEGLFKDPVAARQVLTSEGFEPAHIAFEHTARALEVASTSTKQPELSTPGAPGAPVARIDDNNAVRENPSTSNAPAAVQQEGVLGGLGSRIAQFTGQLTSPRLATSSADPATSSPADAKQPPSVEPQAPPSPQGGSLFTRWFGTDEKGSGNGPVAVAADPDLPKVREAQTFALPQEQSVTQQALSQGDLTRILAPPAKATPDPTVALDRRSGSQTNPGVPAPSASTDVVLAKESFAVTSIGGMVEPLPVDATLSPSRQAPTALPKARAEIVNRSPELRAGGSEQSTLSRLLSGEPPVEQVEAAEPAVASSEPAPAQLVTISLPPDEASASIPAVADSRTRDDEEVTAEALTTGAAQSVAVSDEQTAQAPVEVVISRSSGSAEQFGGWFSGLRTLFLAGPVQEPSAIQSRIEPEDTTLRDEVVAQAQPVSGQDSTPIEPLAEISTADVPAENENRSGAQDTPLVDASAQRNTELENTEQAAVQPPRGGGLLAGLGALLATPFASPDSKDAPAPKPAVQESEASQSLTPSVNTGDEPSIKRRLDQEGKEVVVLVGLPAVRPDQENNQEVLSQSGSRIRQMLDEPSPPSVTVSPTEVATPAAAPLMQSVGSVPPDATQSAVSNSDSAAVVPSLAAPQIALLNAAPATTMSQAVAAVASMDVNSDTGVAASVVLVITPNGSTSGVLVDGNGHLLTNWHSVNEFDQVVVMFKQSSGAKPKRDNPVRARVVAHSKFADLALLEVEFVPVGILPAVVAADLQMETGATIHAIGHAGGLGGDGQWRHDIAHLDRVRRSSSWYSAQRVLHRADVIRVEMDPVQDVSGMALFNNQFELIGLGAMVRADKGEIVGVSVATIRAFLEGPS